MNMRKVYSDEFLQAYLDGAIDPYSSAEFEGVVEGSPSLQRRLLAMEPFADVVGEAFKAGVDETQLPQSALNLAGDPVRVLRWGAASAVLGVLAVIGFGFSTGFNLPKGGELTDWRHSVAVYQTLYTEDTVAGIRTTDDGLDRQFADAEQKLGRSLERGYLESLPGLDLKRAQILGFKGSPLIQVAFADDQGIPFAFCVIRLKEGTPAQQPVYETRAGLATAHWVADGYGYMLVGDTQTQRLVPTVNQLQVIF